MKPTELRVVLAGGGTGGHVFPALAVARALAERGAHCTFVGTARGLEVSQVPAAGFPLEILPVEPMKGGGVRRALRGGMLAATGVGLATRLLGRLRPHAVLGVGGYAAGPLCLAAALRRIPVAILEPNRVPGFTNRLLARVARRAYVAWPQTELAFRGARLSGVPVREGFVATPYAPSSPPRLLVLGGSQGARALNRAVPQALRELAQLGLPVQVLHQTGAKGIDVAREAYAACGLENAEIVPFLDDMPQRLADATLVLGRAGASTVAEITAAGRPSFLVPFPFAADDHQTANARALSELGAGVWLPESELASRLAPELGSLLADGPRLERLAHAASQVGRPGAAGFIADDLLQLARR